MYTTNSVYLLDTVPKLGYGFESLYVTNPCQNKCKYIHTIIIYKNMAIK